MTLPSPVPAFAPMLQFARGVGRVLQFSADSVLLQATIPSPPGSRLEGVLLVGAASGQTLRVKIHGSKKQPDGTFLLEGRPIDLSRGLRDAVAALLAPFSD